MGRNPYSTGYVASKIRENTARRNGASTSGEEQRLAAQTESIFDDLYGAEVAASYEDLEIGDVEDMNAMAELSRLKDLKASRKAKHAGNLSKKNGRRVRRNAGSTPTLDELRKQYRRYRRDTLSEYKYKGYMSPEDSYSEAEKEFDEAIKEQVSGLLTGDHLRDAQMYTDFASKMHNHARFMPYASDRGDG